LFKESEIKGYIYDFKYKFTKRKSGANHGDIMTVKELQAKFPPYKEVFYGLAPRYLSDVEISRLPMGAVLKWADGPGSPYEGIYFTYVVVSKNERGFTLFDTPHTPGETLRPKVVSVVSLIKWNPRRIA
jgi:hypothetical protein